MADRRQRRRDRNNAFGGDQSGGLYTGEAGGYAAQQDPSAYLLAIGRTGGVTGTAGTAFDQWYNDVFTKDIYNDYLATLATPGGRRQSGEQLTFQDYLMTRFGTGYGQGGFTPGTLKQYAQSQFQPYYEEQNPQTKYDMYRTGQGLLGSITGTGVSRAAQDFIRSQGYLTDRTAFEQDHATRPNLTFADWLGGVNTQPTAGPLPATYPADPTTDTTRDRDRRRRRR